MNFEEPKIPPHLEALLQPTPSGVMKLLAAWDGLETESQINILLCLKNEFKGNTWHLQKKILNKAHESPNAYVRYLAAKDRYFWRDESQEEAAFEKKLEEDPSPLVRYCRLEGPHLSIRDEDETPEKFFALPHEARLAKVRLLNGYRSCEPVASWISYAVDHLLPDGRISEDELLEILWDYLDRKSFRQYYQRGTSPFGYNEYYPVELDDRPFWDLVLKVPKEVSHLLLKYLPAKSGKIQSILKKLSAHQLDTFFSRSDIELASFRKRIFFDPDEKFKEARSAACSHHFTLDYGEFANILNFPKERKLTVLSDLALFAKDLQPVIYQAIYHVLGWASSPDSFPLEPSYAGYADDQLKRKITELNGEDQQLLFQELFQLQLYRLAHQVVPWSRWNYGMKSKVLPDELQFLSKGTVPGNTWQTFRNYSKAVGLGDLDLRKHLPKIRFGDIETSIDEQETIEEKWKEAPETPSEIASRIEVKVQEIQATLNDRIEDSNDQSEDSNERLVELVEGLGACIFTLRDQTAARLESLESKLMETQQGKGKVIALLYSAIGLLLLLLVLIFK